MPDSQPLLVRGRDAVIAIARRPRIAAIARSPLTLWLVFVLTHVWLGQLNIFAPGLPMGDVTQVYSFWMEQGRIGGIWVGIDTAWVYPILALVPMYLASVFGTAWIGATWLTMIMLLNALALGVLIDWGRARERLVAGWWWIGFLLLLGPIALGRIDSVTVPLGIIGVLLLARRPRVAGAVLAIATWTKVWPAVLVAAAIVALRDRVRILVSAAVVSVAVVVGALALGAGANVISFVTEQTGRGLQVEAPISTIWLWMTAAHVPWARIYYDHDILTFQTEGPGSAIAAAVMTPLLVVAALAILVLGVRAVRRGVSAGHLLPPLTLALVIALIAFNKVGSPQFMSWIAVPIILGLATHAAGQGVSFRTPAILGWVIAGLTQIIYPGWYYWLLKASPVMLSIITVRNILEFVLLAWAIRALLRAPVGERGEDDHEWLGDVWPLARLTPRADRAADAGTA